MIGEKKFKQFSLYDYSKFETQADVKVLSEIKKLEYQNSTNHETTKFTKTN